VPSLINKAGAYPDPLLGRFLALPANNLTTRLVCDEEKKVLTIDGWRVDNFKTKF
jgi:hypothetical protein